MVTEVEPEKFLEVCYIPDTALVSIAFKGSLEEHQNVSILMFLLGRSWEQGSQELSRKESVLKVLFSFSLALVVQRIGHSPAKGEMQVRFLPRAQIQKRATQVVIFVSALEDVWETSVQESKTLRAFFLSFRKKKSAGCTAPVRRDSCREHK